VDPHDLRRACEIQARGHLLHLREGYIETAGRGDAIAELIRRSASPLAALIRSIARLEGSVSPEAGAAASHLEGMLRLAPGSLTSVVKLRAPVSLTSEEARRIFPAYLDAVGRLTHYIDSWSA
jgi:hypothetical protein